MGPTSTTTITVLGNFSGRNAGDAAILDGLVRDVSETYPRTDLRFLVPTINPGFIRRSFTEQRVEPVGLLPWNLSIKILGVPVVSAVLRSDLVLVTDNILFDRKLYNPLHNYLHTLSWVLPLASRRGVPVVLYNMSLGPVPTAAGKRCLRKIVQASSKIIVREEPSVRLVAELDPGAEAPLIRADCALSAPAAPDERIDAEARRRGIFESGRRTLGLNVNAYLDDYVRAPSERIRPARFQEIFAAVIDRAVSELDVDVLMVNTQPMDRRMERGVLERVTHRDRVFQVQNPELGHREIAGFLKRVDAFVGMRTHSIILAASMLTPFGGIVSYPKTVGFMATLGFADVTLDFEHFSDEGLWSFVTRVWNGRAELRGRLSTVVEAERKKARDAARELEPWLGTPATVDAGP